MVESILTHTSAVSFAGGRASEVLVGSGRAWGVSSPTQHPEPATMGCSSSLGGGEPQATLPCGVACGARGGPSLGAVSAHAKRCHRINQSPSQAEAGSVCRPQATGRRAMISEVQPRGVLAAPRGELRRVSRDSQPAAPKGAACASRRELGRVLVAGSGGSMRITSENVRRTVRNAREESVARWMWSRVIKMVAEVDRRCRTQRSATRPLQQGSASRGRGSSLSSRANAKA